LHRTRIAKINLSLLKYTCYYSQRTCRNR